MERKKKFMSMKFSLVYKGVLTVGLSFAVFMAAAQQQNQQQQNQQQSQQQQTQQQQTQQGERRATIDSIDVIRDYRPILADAVKIRRSPDMTNKREYQPKLSYSIIDKKLDITTGTRRLDIQEMPYTTLDRKTNNYVKIGAGNYSTLLGEVYLTNDQYVDTRFGLNAKILNQKGSLEDQVFGQQEITFFGRQRYEGFTLSGDIGYKRNNTRFFGLNEYYNNLDIENLPEVEKQAFNDIFLDAELVSTVRADDPQPLSYSVKANGYLFSDAFEASENSMAISAYFNKKVNNFQAGGQVSADLTGVSGANTKLANHIARIKPFIGFQGENYDLRVGVNLAAEFGDSSRVNIFPDVHLDFALVPTYAHLFIGVTGDANKTSLRELARENPWLAPNLNIANSLDRFHIYGGIKGNASATFGYKAHLSYRKVENLAFINNLLNIPYMYQVVYENGSKASSIFNFTGEVNLRVSETVSLGGILKFNEFNLQTEEEAWYQPKIEIAANTRINISDRLYLNGEMQFMGQTYASTYFWSPGYQYMDAALSSYYDPINGWAIPVTPEKISIPAFVDLSAGLEFRATEKLGVSIRVNNVLNGGYERYLLYPRLGLNVLGGFNFSF